MAVPADELRTSSTSAPPRVGAEASIAALATTGFRAITDLIGHAVELVALESRAAGSAFTTAVGLALGIALLAVTVWGLLIAAAVAALSSQIGVTWALLVVAGVTLVVGGLLALFLPRLFRRLSFPGTRRLFRRSEP